MAENLTPFVFALEQWYELHKRNLPWRGTHDPYRIWVSEIILQQTRVVQGYDYYLHFISEFPDVAALAAAPEEKVLRVWQGLGYYSRARNMLAAARTVMEKYGGQFPADYSEVRGLKGIGDYTAAAICSIAYNQPYAVLDGNVFRVLSRYFAVDLPIDSTDGRKYFKHLADEMLDRCRPGYYNQAIMDFGALQCVPKSPDCLDCPLADSCLAFAEGKVENFPRKEKKTAVNDRFLFYVIIRKGDSVYLHRRGDKDIWAGLYEPYLVEYPGVPSEQEMAQRLDSQFGDALIRVRRLVDRRKHVLTHRRLWINACLVEVRPDYELQDYELVKIKGIRKYPMPKPIVDIFSELQSNPHP